MDSTSTGGRDPPYGNDLHVDGAKELNEMYGREYESYDDYVKRGGNMDTTTTEGNDTPLCDPYLNEIVQESYSFRNEGAAGGSEDQDTHDLSPIIEYLQSPPLETQNKDFNKKASVATKGCP